MQSWQKYFRGVQPDRGRVLWDAKFYATARCIFGFRFPTMNSLLLPEKIAFFRSLIQNKENLLVLSYDFWPINIVPIRNRLVTDKFIGTSFFSFPFLPSFFFRMYL